MQLKCSLSEFKADIWKKNNLTRKNGRRMNVQNTDNIIITHCNKLYQEIDQLIHDTNIEIRYI